MELKQIGPKYDLELGEEPLIKDDVPSTIEIIQEGFLSKRNLIGNLADVKDVEEAYSLPYLTNKRILLWLLVVSKTLGPMGKWWEMPLEFIQSVKFRDGKSSTNGGIEIVYKVPHLEKGLGRQILGFERGKETFKVILYTKSLPVWKTNLTKLIFTRKSEKLKPKVDSLNKEISVIEGSLDQLEKSLMKGKISEIKYDELKKKYKAELDALKAQLKSNEQELKEIDV